MCGFKNDIPVFLGNRDRLRVPNAINSTEGEECTSGHGGSKHRGSGDGSDDARKWRHPLTVTRGCQVMPT